MSKVTNSCFQQFLLSKESSGPMEIKDMLGQCLSDTRNIRTKKKSTAKDLRIISGSLRQGFEKLDEIGNIAFKVF